MSLIAAAPGRWRPFEDEPLFRSELLLGVEALPEDLATALRTYLRQVAEARTAPIHVACAWNALYFGYDLAARGYRAEVLDPEQFSLLAASAGPRSALPVGAFVRIERGNHWLWSEVVAKFGASPAIDDDGWTPAEISGALAPDEQNEATTLLERTILDMEAFGSLTIDERSEIGRLRHRASLLDAHGHLHGPAAYEQSGLADLDDLGFYARHLLTRARPLLVGGPLGGVLDDLRDDEVIRQALDMSLRTVADLLRTTDGLRVWGPYATPTGRFERDRRAQAVFIDELLHVACRPLHGPRYTAVWPLQAARGGGEMDMATAVRGIVHANLALADHASSARAGLLPGDVHLRVDDLWQGGGVWRSQRAPIPAEIISTDPSYPLGLGHLEYLGQAPSLASIEPPSAPVGDPLIPPSEFEDETTVEQLDDTLLVFTVALRPGHLDDGTLPLPRVIADLSLPGALILELLHDGEPLPDADRVRRVNGKAGRLTGCAWPMSFYPGIKLTVAMARHSRRFTAGTTLLDEAFVVNGTPYPWACDRHILLAALDLADTQAPAEEPSAANDDTPTRRTVRFSPPVDSLRGLIVSALKRHGAPGSFGARRLTGPQLFAALFGLDVNSPPLLWTVIHTCEALVEDGILSREDDQPMPGQPPAGPATFAWWPNQASRSLSRKAADRARTDLARHVHEHWVPPCRRRLPENHYATREAREAYAAWAREVYGPQADPRLPEGYTFVRGHRRGESPDPGWHTSRR
jgi:hypothetical protein